MQDDVVARRETGDRGGKAGCRRRLLGSFVSGRVDVKLPSGLGQNRFGPSCERDRLFELAAVRV